MKYILLFLLIPFIGKTQEVSHLFPIVDGKVNYTSIIEVEGTNKNQLYSKIKDWAVNSYKSQKATLQAEDKEAGYLAYKGILPITSYYHAGMLKGKPYTVNIYHTLKFYIKEDKVKIVFEDLLVQSLDAARMMIAKNNINLIEPVHIESGIAELNGKITKQRKAYLESTFRYINLDVSNFLKNLEKHIISGKSEFEF